MSKANTDRENLFMAATMLPFLLPAYAAYASGRLDTAAMILLEAVASALYHVHETQKHLLSGLSISPLSDNYWCEVLINIDRAGAVLLALLILTTYPIDAMLDSLNISVAIFALFAMTLSETVYRYELVPYIYFHSAWHVLSAVLLYLIVSY